MRNDNFGTYRAALAKSAEAMPTTSSGAVKPPIASGPTKVRTFVQTIARFTCARAVRLASQEIFSLLKIYSHLGREPGIPVRDRMSNAAMHFQFNNGRMLVLSLSLERTLLEAECCSLFLFFNHLNNSKFAVQQRPYARAMRVLHCISGREGDH